MTRYLRYFLLAFFLRTVSCTWLMDAMERPEDLTGANLCMVVNMPNDEANTDTFSVLSFRTKVVHVMSSYNGRHMRKEDFEIGFKS